MKSRLSNSTVSNIHCLEWTPKSKNSSGYEIRAPRHLRDCSTIRHDQADSLSRVMGRSGTCHQDSSCSPAPEYPMLLKKRGEELFDFSGGPLLYETQADAPGSHKSGDFKALLLEENRAEFADWARTKASGYISCARISCQQSPKNKPTCSEGFPSSLV